ncbi:cation transporter [Haladaptatus sp. F3-133]|uniref:Cation transporter n=1 Tax=Halorutilus salinus TaxID=2487751 RepID=A0A9Q4C4R6_9EURY|nr:cation transporter [Halorutilus salinus]MCX2819822.1 cation transporter [Halorutilus salinus]
MEIKIRGMSCEGCEENVEDAISGIDGVRSVRADRDTDTATVEGDADEDAIAEAVEEAGYEVET